MSKLNHQRSFVFVILSAFQTQIRITKLSKAPGYDGLQTEHLLSATTLLTQYLSVLLRACIAQQYIPAALLEDLVTYVLKKEKPKGV